MRVLLHTPLKPPDSATPSGDREMARGLVRLLRRLGHTVVMPAASRVPPGVPAPAAHLALDGKIVHDEEILPGLEHAPGAIAQLYRGDNHGKLIIAVD